MVPPPSSRRTKDPDLNRRVVFLDVGLGATRHNPAERAQNVNPTTGNTAIVLATVNVSTLCPTEKDRGLVGFTASGQRLFVAAQLEMLYFDAPGLQEGR